MFSAVSLAFGTSVGLMGLPHLLIRFFTVPDRKPRTLCACHPDTFCISSSEAPCLRRNRARIWSCLEPEDDKDSLGTLLFCCCAVGFLVGLFGAAFLLVLVMLISVTFAPANPALSLRKARVAIRV